MGLVFLIVFVLYQYENIRSTAAANVTILRSQNKTSWIKAHASCKTIGAHFLPDIEGSHVTHRKILADMAVGEFLWINSVQVHKNDNLLLKTAMHFADAKIGSYLFKKDNGISTPRCNSCGYSWNNIDENTRNNLVSLTPNTSIQRLAMLMASGVNYWVQNSTGPSVTDWTNAGFEVKCVGLLKISGDTIENRTDNCSHAHPVVCVTGAPVALAIGRPTEKLPEMECKEVNTTDSTNTTKDDDLIIVSCLTDVSDGQTEPKDSPSIGLIMGPVFGALGLMVVVVLVCGIVRRRKHLHYRRRLEQYDRRQGSNPARRIEIVPPVAAIPPQPEPVDGSDPQLNYEELENSEAVRSCSYVDLQRKGSQGTCSSGQLPSYDKWSLTSRDSSRRSNRQKNYVNPSASNPEIQQCYEQFELENLTLPLRKGRDNDGLSVIPEVPPKSKKKRNQQEQKTTGVIGEYGEYGYKALSLRPYQNGSADVSTSVYPVSQSPEAQTADDMLNDLDQYENQEDVLSWNIGNPNMSSNKGISEQPWTADADDQAYDDEYQPETYENYVYNLENLPSRRRSVKNRECYLPMGAEKQENYENFTPKTSRKTYVK